MITEPCTTPCDNCPGGLVVSLAHLRRCSKIPSLPRPQTPTAPASSGMRLHKYEDPAPSVSAGDGVLGTSCEVPPAGFEPAHTAPEAVALSPELRGRVGRLVLLAATGRTLPAWSGWS